MNANEQFYSQPSNLSTVKTYNKKDIQRGAGNPFDVFPKSRYYLNPNMNSPVKDEIRKLSREGASARKKLFWKDLWSDSRYPDSPQQVRLRAFIQKTSKRIQNLVDEHNRNYKSDHPDYIYKVEYK